MTDAETPNVQLVKRAYAAFQKGDIDAVVDAMHPDIEWHEAEHSPWHAPDGHHGPTAVLANVLARIAEDFDRFEVVPHRFHDAGTTVMVEGRYRAHATATSDPLDAQVCHVWTIRGGKLAGFQQYTDTWQFARVTRTPTA
jgi:hypothetical protein